MPFLVSLYGAVVVTSVLIAYKYDDNTEVTETSSFTASATGQTYDDAKQKLYDLINDYIKDYDSELYNKGYIVKTHKINLTFSK